MGNGGLARFRRVHGYHFSVAGGEGLGFEGVVGVVHLEVSEVMGSIACTRKMST